MHQVLRQRHVLLGVVSTAVLALAVSRPELLGDRVADALDGLGSADPMWLWAAGGLFALMHGTGAMAWRAALAACGTRLPRRDTAARYCVGSGLNAVAPAHVGSAVRVVLFARVTDDEGGAWRVAGAGAAVGAVRAAWLAVVVAAAAALGAIPAWPLAVLLVVLAGAAGVALASRRVRTARRAAHLLDAFRELGRSPGALASVAVLTAAGMAVKLAAATAVALSFGIDRPLVAALVLVPAVELAAALPVTPGNVGVASAAVALALGSTGVDEDTALAAGIAFGAVEGLAAVAVGAAGVLALSGRALPAGVRWAAGSASVFVLGSVCALTVV